MSMTNDEKRRVFKAYFLYGILGAKDEIYCLTGNEFEADFIEAKFAGMDAAKKHKARALNNLAINADDYSLAWINSQKKLTVDVSTDTLAAIDAGVDDFV